MTTKNEPDKSGPHVYKAISAVMAEMAKTGISKDNKNQQQGYKFRGIDDVYNALAPLLSKHGLLILPRTLTRTPTERQTQKGGVLFHVVLEMEFDFVSSVDGSMHTVSVTGEAMDSADKATNKAMSAAYKYACIEAFCIPTEGDNDADGTTHEVAPNQSGVRSEPKNNEPVPVSADELKLILDEIAAANSPQMFMQAREKSRALYRRMTVEQRKMVKDRIDDRLRDFPDAPQTQQTGVAA